MNYEGYVRHLGLYAIGGLVLLFCSLYIFKAKITSSDAWHIKGIAVKIDKPLLQKIAYLAQIEIDVHNEASMLKELNRIITWIEKLRDIDTTDVKPLVTMTSAYNILQEDIPQAPLAHEKGLYNAPSKDSNYFRVPQVKE